MKLCFGCVCLLIWLLVCLGYVFAITPKLSHTSFMTLLVCVGPGFGFVIESTPKK